MHQPALRFRSPPLRLFSPHLRERRRARCAHPVPSLSKSCPRLFGVPPQTVITAYIISPPVRSNPNFHFFRLAFDFVLIVDRSLLILAETNCRSTITRYAMVAPIGQALSRARPADPP